MAAWLAGREGTLETAFGIAAAQSQRSARTTAAIAARDDWIRRGAKEFGLGAPELAEVIADFEARTWPREAHLDSCPERHRGAIRWHLWHAMRAWPYAPKERRLRDIVGNEHPGLIAEQPCDSVPEEGRNDDVPTDERIKRRSNGS